MDSNKKITLSISIRDLNEMIRNSFTEDSDVSSLMIRNEKEAQDFILDALEEFVNPTSKPIAERMAFDLGRSIR